MLLCLEEGSGESRVKGWKQSKLNVLLLPLFARLFIRSVLSVSDGILISADFYSFVSESVRTDMTVNATRERCKRGFILAAEGISCENRDKNTHF